MEYYNIIDEAEAILAQHVADSTDNADAPNTDDTSANNKAKGMLFEVQRLVEPLEYAYWEARMLRDWERALLISQRMASIPFLFGISSQVYNKREWIRKQNEFIGRAEEWVGEVKQLLQYTKYHLGN